MQLNKTADVSLPFTFLKFSINVGKIMIKIKKGLDLPISGGAGSEIVKTDSVTKVALLGSDYPGLRPTMLVDVGDSVKKGQPLFEDKKNPGVVYTAPLGGKVAEINRGERRCFVSLVIQVDETSGAVGFDKYDAKNLLSVDRQAVVDELVKSGLWTAFRTRPFAKVPAVTSQPKHIFVTAMDTNPLAPDVKAIINSRADDFSCGLNVISRLTEGTVYVCKGDYSLPQGTASNIKEEVFVGPHPAGLAGTHMHKLVGASLDRVLWNIGYQDVIAIGKLFTTGELDSTRYVAIGGPGVISPRLVQTVAGACVSELTDGNIKTSAKQRVISGSVIYGRKAEGVLDYMGRYFTQISIIPEGDEKEFLGWMLPGFKKFSVSNTFIGPFFNKKKDFVFNTGVNGGARAIIPFGCFDRILPMDIIPSLLLRAIAITDTDEAQALGCLELDEEDLALCTYVDPCKSDFGPMLRRCLNKIEQEG